MANVCNFTIMETATIAPVTFTTGAINEIKRLMNEEGLSRNDAIKQAAKSRGLSKRDAYQLMLKEKETNEDQV